MNRIPFFALIMLCCFSRSTALSQSPVGFSFGVGVDLPAGNLASNQSHGAIFTATGQTTYRLQDNGSFVADLSYHSIGYSTENSFDVVYMSIGPRIEKWMADGNAVYLTLPMMGAMSAGGYVSPTVGFGMGILLPSPDHSSNHNADFGIRFTHAGPFASGHVREVNILNIQLALGIF
jgi:hypothetical protein